jgi:hypothetical protein
MIIWYTAFVHDDITRHQLKMLKTPFLLICKVWACKTHYFFINNELKEWLVS